jgi:hypothetical protein
MLPPLITATVVDPGGGTIFPERSAATAAAPAAEAGHLATNSVRGSP